MFNLILSQQNPQYSLLNNSDMDENPFTRSFLSNPGKDQSQQVPIKYEMVVWNTITVYNEATVMTSFKT